MINLDKLDLKGKKVLIRLDLNVTSRNPKEITKEERFNTALPLIQYVTKKGGKAILMSHLGRPDGKKVREDSLKCVAEALESKLNTKVAFPGDCIGKKVEDTIESMENGDITLLENLRFHPEEKSNNPTFAKSLAKLGNVYINDAFGTAHRKHASIYGIPTLFKGKKPVAMGLLMQKEIDMWSSVMDNKGPKYLCIGGAKLKEKINALAKLSGKFDKTYIGGLVYNVVRAAQERSIGISKITEKDEVDYVAKTKEFLDGVENIVMPDYLTIAKPTKGGFTDAKKIAESDEVPKGYAIVDCIYEGRKLEQLSKANVGVCFGPFGVFEKEKGEFAEGTNNIGRAFNNIKVAIFAGGDSGTAYGSINANFSTGGGASIEYLESKKLVAINALK
jgi:3-phosphoglycerate kinase